MAWLLLLLVIALGVLYYWLIGVPGYGKASPYGRIGVIPRRIADSLTDFDEKPPPNPPWAEQEAEERHRTGASPAPAPAPETVPEEWQDLVRSMRSRIQTALGDEFAVECDPYGLALHHGASYRQVPLAGCLEPPPADRTDRAVRACLQMLEHAQAFRVNELDSRWPVRTSPGTRAPASQAVPRAVVVQGAIHPGYHDNAGIVLDLDPVEWPTSR